MLTRHKRQDQMGNTNDHQWALETTSQLPLVMLPGCLSFGLWAQLLNHYSVLIALHNFFSLLHRNYSRITKLHSPLPVSPPRLRPAGILVHGHVWGVTNCCCLCSHNAPGHDSLWIIFTLPPAGDLNPNSRSQCFIRNHSGSPLAHRDPALRNLTLPIYEIGGSRTTSGDRQTDEKAPDNKRLQCCSQCWPPFPWDLVVMPPLPSVRI